MDEELIKITQEELDKRLEDHKLWLEDPSQGKKAILYGHDLTELDLKGRNLSHVNLNGSSLSDMDLRDCDLSNTWMKYTRLDGADLRGANLKDIDGKFILLEDTNLTGRFNNDIANSFYGSDWWTSHYDDVWKPLSNEEQQIEARKIAQNRSITYWEGRL